VNTLFGDFTSAFNVCSAKAPGGNNISKPGLYNAACARALSFWQAMATTAAEVGKIQTQRQDHCYEDSLGQIKWEQKAFLGNPE
jgi:Thiamine pyrophosphate enzyme, C-terminal TPP binding domain